VTDRTSKLMWVRCSVGQTWENGQCAGVAGRYSWQSAQQNAMQINRDGKLFFNDWRLPHLRELALITERQCKSPRINLTVFPETPSAGYWTASSRSAEAADGFAFVLAFDTEGIRYADKQELLHVRLVRHAR
jgi:hypothetical protein